MKRLCDSLRIIDSLRSLLIIIFLDSVNLYLKPNDRKLPTVYNY